MWLTCFFCLFFQQTKTGLALLYDEHTSNTYDVRLKLTKELLVIQKQDVVCVNGGDSHLNVSTESLPSTWSIFKHTPVISSWFKVARFSSSGITVGSRWVWSVTSFHYIWHGCQEAHATSLFLGMRSSFINDISGITLRPLFSEMMLSVHNESY